MTLPAWQRTPLRKCAIVVDRHVHKNGGSTVRDLFLEHERLGLALYQGYTQMYWNRDYRLLRRAGEVALRQGKRAPEHVILMEAHFGWVELAQQVRVATPALYRHRRPTPPQPALPPWSASPRSPAARSTFTAGATLSPGALAHVPVFGGRLPARPDDTSEGAARLLPVLLSMGRRVPAEAGPAELWEELYRVRPIDAPLTVLHTTR